MKSCSSQVGTPQTGFPDVPQLRPPQTTGRQIGAEQPDEPEIVIAPIRVAQIGMGEIEPHTQRWWPFTIGLGGTLRLANFILLFWLFLDTQRACSANAIGKSAPL